MRLDWMIEIGGGPEGAGFRVSDDREGGCSCIRLQNSAVVRQGGCDGVEPQCHPNLPGSCTECMHRTILNPLWLMSSISQTVAAMQDQQPQHASSANFCQYRDQELCLVDPRL